MIPSEITVVSLKHTFYLKIRRSASLNRTTNLTCWCPSAGFHGDVAIIKDLLLFQTDRQICSSCQMCDFYLDLVSPSSPEGLMVLPVHYSSFQN